MTVAKWTGECKAYEIAQSSCLLCCVCGSHGVDALDAASCSLVEIRLHFEETCRPNLPVE
jgi:hypothetical protein